MVLYTGDTHGHFDRIVEFIQRMELGNTDTIVILGDAGFNFYGNYFGDAPRKKRVNDLGVTIFSIHGNHEMRPATIDSYEIKEWNGGRVWVEPEYPNLLFACDGDIYNLDGISTIVIGGAYSVDKYYRIARNPYSPKWWPDEQPDEATKQRVEQQLEECGWEIDMVLSHTCPQKYIPTEAFISGVDQKSVDNSTENWLDQIEDKLKYQAWFCGHWHIEKKIDKMQFLFNDVAEAPKMNREGSST